MGNIKRVSTCVIDIRAELTPRDLTDIKRQYQNRLFVNGRNSMDVQMKPALSYKSSKSLYRFLSGDLMSTVRVEHKRGKVQVSVFYDNIVLNKLEEHYGFMFAWSKSDVAYIDKVVESRLIAQGFEPTSDLDLKINRDLTLEDERLLIINEMNVAKSETTNEATPIAIPELTEEEANRKNSIAGTLNFQYIYDPSLSVSQTDIQDIQNHIRDRVMVGNLTVNDTLIKIADRPYLDSKTLNSIKITKPRNGILNLKITFYTQEALSYHTKGTAIFGFSPKDMDYIDMILSRQFTA